MIRRLFHNISNQKTVQRRAELYRNLIRHEARIGGQLFGPVAPGGRREFFCLDEHTWVWHEETINANGQRQSVTTRYDVRPSGVVKSQNGHYQSLTVDEARHLRDAIQAYQKRVKAELYPFAA